MSLVWLLGHESLDTSLLYLSLLQSWWPQYAISQGRGFSVVQVHEALQVVGNPWARCQYVLPYRQ